MPWYMCIISLQRFGKETRVQLMEELWLMEDYLWLSIEKPCDLEIQHLCFAKMQLIFVFKSFSCMGWMVCHLQLNAPNIWWNSVCVWTSTHSDAAGQVSLSWPPSHCRLMQKSETEFCSIRNSNENTFSIPIQFLYSSIIVPNEATAELKHFSSSVCIQFFFEFIFI